MSSKKLHRNSFGGRLRQVREFLKKTQDQFAKKLDLNRSYLSLLENDERKPSDKLLLLIEHEWGIRREYLLKGVEPRFRDPFIEALLSPPLGGVYKNTHGDRLRQALESLQIPFQRCLTDLGVTADYLNNWLQNKIRPTMLFLLAVEYRYGISLDWLAFGRGEMLIDQTEITADKLRELKKLADENVITQQDFERKKKQFLNLD